MQKSKQVTFQIYRYQILPISQIIQLQFHPEIKSIEQLKASKNEIFKEVVTNLKKVSYSRTELAHKLIADAGSFLILKIGARKRLNRSTRDFKEEELENWPAVLIVINNDAKVQKVAIQVNRKVFNEPETVIKILQSNLNRSLQAWQLHVMFEATFEEHEFWTIVNENKAKITQAEFLLTSPNLANIADGLKLDLHKLNRDTNTQKTKLQLNSDKDSALTLSPDDAMIKSLVKYSSEGGGNISLKIRGINKKIRTKDCVKEVSVKELELNNVQPKDIPSLIKEILNG